ncbi:protein cordon-bleu isoform X12 [Nasonia vitripennis]|uniref:WH2 domain-containing protein n=1 Tax=Nasonia vitripennis TaxID=7425 RepID=A0A7M7QZZ0_NASVI|nr:protein cordon-bleu isoform X12 [Nasonia vitripennis]
MLCLKKRRTYSFTQGACAEAPRQSRHRSVSSSKRDGRAEEQRYSEGIAVAVATLPRKLGPREERSSAMVLTVTEDTPADMLAGSMELLVQMPRDHQVQTQRVTVQRSTPMMDLLVQITTAHKLAASSYTLQAIGERGLVLHHQPNTPIGALDALQVKLLPKQGTFLQRKSRQTNQPFETTFRLQVHLPRNQLYVSRVSPKTNLGEILDEVCREKNLDRNKYELRHPANLAETLDLSLTLQDYHLQEVTLCPRQQSRTLMGSALSSQDIMALQKQEECRRQQAQRNSGGGVFGFMFKKSKESSVSTDSLGNRSVSPARSDETARSASPQQQQQQLMRNNFNGQQMPPNRPLRKRRPAPKPPTQGQQLESKIEQTTTVSRTQSKSASDNATTTTSVPGKDKIVISHSRNSSDSSGYHEASVLSDNPDNNGQGGRMPETLPRRGRMQGILEAPRKLAHTSQASKSLGNLAMASSQAGTLSRGVSNTSLSSAGQRKKRAAPPPPIARPLPSAISTQGLERIVDSDESLTSDMDLSKPSSDIDASASKASSDIVCSSHVRGPIAEQPEDVAAVEPARVGKRGIAPPTDTDILLQKVSDTLSHSLTPPSPPPTPEETSILEVPNFVANNATINSNNAAEEKVMDVKNVSNAKESRENHHQSTLASESSNNATLGSQQDTSDYVSANGEDLSIGDWEYQIPAPPSAFRDDDNESSVEEKVSVQPVREPISIEAEVHQTTTSAMKPIEPPAEPKPSPPEQKPVVKAIPSVDQVDFVRPKPPPKLVTTSPQLSTTEVLELSKKAEVISELETKINSHKPIIEPVVARDDESYAPKIAPVENNLSNFTITTYSRQKSLDIFENMEQPVHSETRVLSTFATLTRGRSIVADYAEERVWNGGIKSAQSMERVSVPLVDDRTKFAERNDMLREKVSVHRSKSYITLSSNEKFQNRANEIEKSKEEKKLDDHTNYEIKDSSKRFTSLANVNQSTNDEIPRHKEKFSQWRDNILRKQEEPSKEKQLQSLQVLKSILPQLKNAQATEENGYKSTSDNFTIKKRQEPQCEEPQETPTVSSTTPDVQLRVNRRPQEPSKRYTYGGPPAVSLGSWSERPCVNVQIKTDTDYKFGGKNNPNHSTSGAKTVVNLNGGGSHTVEEKSERMQKENGVTSQESKEPMVVHTKPVVAERDDESRVDTTSVNFRELTKAFGQDVRLRPKPPVRNPHNRLSEYLERPKPEVIASKQNGFAEPHVTTTTFNHNLRNTNGPVPPVKRYTSVVGITNNNNTVNNNNVNHIGANNNNNKVHHANGASNFRFTNGSAPKPTVTTAATKGLIQKEKEYTVPKPPTMPIITGVTLKSVNARPKSSPPMVQADPRDQLLESIRNFGGRQKLRSTAEKY